MALIVDISLLTKVDIPATAEIPALAMHTDPISRTMFGFEHEIESATKFNKELIQFTHNLPNHHIAKATLKSTGEIVGMAQIEFQDGALNVDVPLDALPPSTNLAFCEAMFGAFGTAHAKHMRGKRHVALHSLHVLPPYQQKGIGTELLKWLFKTYNLEKELIWLNTQLRGRDRLYSKFGWQDMEVIDIDLSKFLGEEGNGFGIHRSVGMLRYPGKLNRKGDLSLAYKMYKT